MMTVFGGGDLRRHPERQRRVLEGDGDRAVGVAGVCTGICTPCMISASTLFCVVTRGVESTRPLPVRSSADSATSRLKAPLTAPSARPIAEAGRRLTRPAVFDDRCRPPAVLSRPTAERARVGEREVRRVADLGRHAAVQAPLDADRAGELTRGRDDARLDFDLRLGAIERRRAAARIAANWSGRSAMISVLVRTSTCTCPQLDSAASL